jgi:hypothetical protein
VPPGISLGVASSYPRGVRQPKKVLRNVFLRQLRIFLWIILEFSGEKYNFFKNTLSLCY